MHRGRLLPGDLIVVMDSEIIFDVHNTIMCVSHSASIMLIIGVTQDESVLSRLMILTGSTIGFILPTGARIKLCNACDIMN